MRAIVFRLVQIVLLPVAAVAYAIFVVKLVAYSRRTGASATVLASLYTRYMQHELGTRRDEPCARLMAVMPSVSPLGLHLLTAGTLVGHRLTGYVPKIYRYPFPGEPEFRDQPAARTTFYDATVERYLPKVEQLVILGAGFDTRSYRLPADAPVRCFEVDGPKTQAFKRETIERAGVDASHVTFVPADFLVEDWLAKLTAAGFAPDRPTLFTWESVTMYLDRESVASTLRKIGGTAAGSAVAFDYFSDELIASRSLAMRYARAVIRLVGEPWTFGLDNTPPVRERVREFVATCGLALEEQRDFGPETPTRRAPAGFAVAIVPRSLSGEQTEAPSR